jgi:hypothetical protein
MVQRQRGDHRVQLAADRLLDQRLRHRFAQFDRQAGKSRLEHAGSTIAGRK